MVEDGLVDHLDNWIARVQAALERLVEHDVTDAVHEALMIEVGLVRRQLLRISPLEHDFGGDFHLLACVERLQIIDDTDLVAPFFVLRIKQITRHQALAACAPHILHYVQLLHAFRRVHHLIERIVQLRVLAAAFLVDLIVDGTEGALQVKLDLADLANAKQE